MSDLVTEPSIILIAGEEHLYALNMAALDAITAHGYSGENGEGDFGQAFADAEDGNIEAMRLIAWAGLLPSYQDKTTGEVDFTAAPPMSVTNLMTFGEMVMASGVASAAFIASLPEGTLESIEKAQREREAAEAEGRPTQARP